MAYVEPNFKTKKELKEAVKNGTAVYAFAPGLGSIPQVGEISVEGPHYPKPHTWYARVTVNDGRVVAVK